MVSFIDAAPARFKHEVTAPFWLRAGTGGYLGGAGLKKGRDWVRRDDNTFSPGLDLYRFKSAGASVMLELWLSTQRCPDTVRLIMAMLKHSRLLCLRAERSIKP